MVDAFVASEDAQLAGMASFIRSVGLTAAIGGKQWKTFARVYNGADYAKNKYDAHLQLFCAQYEVNGCPDLMLRAAQVMLNYRGYDTGGVDGLKGKLTTNALRAFQRSANLPVTGQPDAPTLAALHRPV